MGEIDRVGVMGSVSVVGTVSEVVNMEREEIDNKIKNTPPIHISFRIDSAKFIKSGEH